MEGPAVVDIFQRVGTISLGLLQKGNFVEAAILWPGLQAGETLRLRVAVGSVDLAPAVEAEAQEAPPNREPSIDLAEEEEALNEALPETPRKAKLATFAPGGAQLFVVEPVSPLPQPPTPTFAAAPIGEPQPVLRHSLSGHHRDRPIVLSNCDQIIPNLYLGGIAAASDTKELVAQGIRAVCCCVRELEFPTKEFHPEVAYYRVDVEDISREPIELYFPEATEFIHSWVSREQPVLVHCRAGVSRSASVVIAYLVTYHGYSLHDAFFLVRSHRSIVTPNIGFMEKLGDYEEAKRGTEPTIDINKYVAWYSTPDRDAVPDLKPD